MSIMSYYIRHLSNKSLDKAYYHAMHMDLYAEMFIAGVISCIIGVALTYAVGCLTSGNPWALMIAVMASVWYTWDSISRVDILVLNEWRARAWAN